MMRAGFCVALLLAALVACDARALAKRELTQTATSTACAAKATAGFILTAPGVATVTAEGFCRAEADAQSAIFELWGDYVNKTNLDAQNGCTEVELDLLIEGTAEAIANVYVQVSGEADITPGAGVACFSASAGGDAFAVAILDFIVDISLTLIDESYPMTGYGQEAVDAAEKTNEVSGRIPVRIATAIVSKAWAEAQTSLCTTDGWTADQQVSFASQVKTAVAELGGVIALSLCQNVLMDPETLKEWRSNTANTTAMAVGELAIEEDQVVFVSDPETGDAKVAEVAQVPACADGTGPGGFAWFKASVCCAPTATSNCLCGTGCSMNEISKIGGVTVWEDIMGEQCSCII